jgi:hypothetical protein
MPLPTSQLAHNVLSHTQMPQYEPAKRKKPSEKHVFFTLVRSSTASGISGLKARKKEKSKKHSLNQQGRQTRKRKERGSDLSKDHKLSSSFSFL